MEVSELKKAAFDDFKKARDEKALNTAFKKYLGKDGQLALVLASLKKTPLAKRRLMGRKANQLKQELLALTEQRKEELRRQERQAKAESDWFDITVPGKKPASGHLHPLTLTQRKSAEIFQQLGFSVIEGPEIETEWYNFDALNIPKEHPARDMWDTFWLKEPKSSPKLLLRTHTSPVQVRYMEKRRPPLRIVVPGRVFRHEASDASHDVQFYQLEGLMVDRDVSAANFKAIVQEFLRRFFAKPVKIRLRPSFFPFVEPGFEIDMTCVVCNGKGCPLCSKTGWLEMAGAGMVHPAVFRAAGLNPNTWTGFAFGMGLDRLTMMKYKINDLRLFYSGDLRFLDQF